MSLPPSWFELVPKVELHLHLEGAIPLPTLWQLVRKYGAADEVGSLAALTERFTYRDFPHFLDTWFWKNGFLRAYEDFTLIAEAVARALVAQRVLHAEVFFSPPDFPGLAPARLAEAIREGLDRVPEASVLLVADLVRDSGPQQAARTLAALEGTRPLGVVGIGIGGSEHRFPPAPFAAVYERARTLGLRTSAHAGEAAGPASVWSALVDLRADRLGHGTRAVEDPRLVAELAARRVPVEACPLSNLRTGVCPALTAHPVRAFFDAGIPCSINTDDPEMFGTTLAGELSALHHHLGFTAAELRQLTMQAARDSWLPEPARQQLLTRVAEDPAWDG